MWGSSNSLVSQNQQFINPLDVNKIHIRTKISDFQVSVPFLNESSKNIYVECFTVTTLGTGAENVTNASDQYFLYCDNAKGFYRANGKQTLLTAIANWDGDTNYRMFSIMNSHPFQIQRHDNLLNFIITKSTASEGLYPNDSEGTPFPNGIQNDYLFNIVLNIISAEE